MSAASPRRSHPLSVAARWVIGLSWLNLAALGAVCWLLFIVSEGWWVGTVLTYAPRSPFLAPTLGLIIAAVFWHRPSLWVNAASAAIVLGPVMGLSLPIFRLFNAPRSSDAALELKIVSCNVQAFKPDFAKVLEEIEALQPDVVALQEAYPPSPLLESAFRGWHTVNYDLYWVGSRYPLKLVTKCEVATFERSAGMIVEIETPSGPVLLGDIHQMTARRGLTELSRDSLFDGAAQHGVELHQIKRDDECVAIRDLVDTARGDRPLIVVGDFNTPASSQLFQRYWGDFQSAFDVAGYGYGYTSPCKANRFWPENFPWARIDHILCSPEWTVRSCQIGHSNGSDHRLIAATLLLMAPPQLPTSDTVAGLQ